GSCGSSLYLQNERAFGARLPERRAAAHGHEELAGLAYGLRQRERHTDVTAARRQRLVGRRDDLLAARDDDVREPHAVGQEAHREAPLLLAQRADLLLQLLRAERDLRCVGAGLIVGRRRHERGRADRVALPADAGGESGDGEGDADAGRHLRQRDAGGFRRHRHRGRRAGDALEYAVALGIRRMRRERKRARLRDRDPGGRGFFDLRAVCAVGIAGAARRVDELQEDQRWELRPDAHAAAVASDAARGGLRAGGAAVAATTEDARGGRDRLDDDLDRT